jgi:hypothetical protein
MASSLLRVTKDDDKNYLNGLCSVTQLCNSLSDTCTNWGWTYVADMLSYISMAEA